MTRSRRRARSVSLPAIVAAVAALLVLTGGLGTAAFTTGALDRNSAVDVTEDTVGAYGIDTASAVHTNSTETLVTLTNRLDRDATVTVTLRSDSTDTGDLVVDGTNHGDQATVSLAAGSSQRIDIAVPDDSSLVGRTVYFHADATANGLSVSADDRAVLIES